MKMDRFDEIVGRGARAEGFAALDEGARVEVIRQAGMVPPVCGDDIPCAPARGPVRAVDFMAAYPDGQDAYVFKPAGFLGRKTMVRADVFNPMAAQAARKGRAFGLTVSQVAMGRTYRALVERHSAGAMRCSSVEAMPSGSGGGDADGFTEARLASSRRIDLLRARVGPGSAMVVRRIRPSVRGSRASIPDLALVDRVCLADEDISAVLRAYGWSVKGDTVQALTAALSAALERMIGPAVRRDIQVIHL